jgi:hypothetical protein
MRILLITIKSLTLNDTGMECVGRVIYGSTEGSVPLEFVAALRSSRLENIVFPSDVPSIRLRHAETVYQLIKCQLPADSSASLGQQRVLREAVFDHLINVYENLVSSLTVNPSASD